MKNVKTKIKNRKGGPWRTQRNRQEGKYREDTFDDKVKMSRLPPLKRFSIIDNSTEVQEHASHQQTSALQESSLTWPQHTPGATGNLQVL